MLRYVVACALVSGLSGGRLGGQAGAQAADQPVVIAAASSLQFALPEIIAAYQKANPKAARLQVSYGGSGHFFAQIKNGAPYALFLSADQHYPLALEQAGLAISGTRKTYAQGHLVLWLPPKSPLAPQIRQGLNVLVHPAIRKVALANPKLAPYGAASVALLQQRGLYDKVKSKLIFAEDINGAAQYASTAADAGLLALSTTKAPTFAALGGTVWRLPANQTKTMLSQQMILLKEDATARSFWAFMTSPTARSILARYGLQ